SLCCFLFIFFGYHQYKGSCQVIGKYFFVTKQLFRSFFSCRLLASCQRRWRVYLRSDRTQGGGRMGMRSGDTPHPVKEPCWLLGSSCRIVTKEVTIQILFLLCHLRW